MVCGFLVEKRNSHIFYKSNKKLGTALFVRQKSSRPFTNHFLVCLLSRAYLRSRIHMYGVG